MSQTPVEANVVLTADNNQYDSSMQSSASITEQVGKSVDSLAGKIDRLSKAAGKKMMLFGAAEAAGVTSMTMAYGALEKQLSQLQAQSSTLSKTVADQKRLFGEYASEVNGLRSAFGASTRDAAELVQTLSKLNDRTAAVSDLANTFTRLSAVTGESSVSLANSMSTLQKVMGAPQMETEKLSNQLVTLQARSNASAQSILDFGTQIAPVARQVGMSTTDVMGFSNAFIKAGQDGYRAATVFNRMMSDISTAAASGSPDLAKYSNLVGLTVGQFNQLGGSEKFLRVIDSINRQGPQAIAKLNQMGYDGASTVRTITALAQSGNLQTELAAARGSNPDALKKSSALAMDGLFDNLSKLRSELTMTGESFGQKFAGPMNLFIQTLDKGAQAVHGFTSSGLGTIVSYATAGAAGFVALGGAILTASKALLAFSAINTLFRNSATAGFRDATAMSPAARAAMVASGTKIGLVGAQTPLGPRGAAMAAKDPNFVANSMYRGMGWLGLRTPGVIAPGAAGGPGLMSRSLNAAAYYGMTGTGWFARNFLGTQFAGGAVRIPGLQDSGGLTNPAMRPTVFSSPTALGTLGWVGRMGQGVREGVANFRSQVFGDGSQITSPVSPSQGPITWRNGMASVGQDGLWIRAKALAEQFRTVEGASKTFGTGLQNLTRDLTKTGMMIGASGMGAGKTIGGWLMGGIGSLLSNPITVAMLGVGAYGALKNETHLQDRSFSGTIDPYAQAGGMTPVLATASNKSLAPATPRSTFGAMNVSNRDIAYARQSGYNPTSSIFKDTKSTKDAQALLSGQWSYIQDNPQAIQSLKLDLIDAYGAGGADTILQNLQNGSAGSINFGTMLQPAFEVNRRWMGLKGEDQDAIGQPLQRAFGVISDRSEMAGLYGGSKAQFGVLGANTNQLLAGLYSAYQVSDLTRNQSGWSKDIQGNWIGGDGGTDFGKGKYQGGFMNGMAEKKLSPARMKAMADALSKNGFGASFTQGDMAVAMNAMIGAKDATGATKEFFRNYFTGNGVSEDDQVAFLTDRGIPLSQAQNMSTQERINAAMKFGFSFTPASTNFNDPKSLASRISNLQGVGDLWKDPALQSTLLKTGDQNAQMKGAQDFIDSLRAQGMSNPEIYKTLGNIKSTARTSSASEYQFADLAQQFVGRDIGFSMADMNRTQQFGTQTAMFQAAMSIKPTDEKSQQNREQAIQDYFSQAQSQKQYFTQLLYQQREFDVMRSRAEDDFNLSRQYAEADYDRNRDRALQDYNLQRSRAEYEFNLSQKRATADFNLSRKRQEQDYQHSVVLMTEQAAQQMYDIYTRTQVQRTDSAGWLLFNSNDQIRDMQQQSHQLNALRKRGLTNDAIQQLGLNDPKNAQQLARFWDDVMQDPSLIKKFNDMVQKRLKAAGKLTTDESSTEWTEFRRSYNLARTRAQEDFQKSLGRSKEDFARSMGQQEDDFRRSMSRQAEDYQIGMDRQADAYKKTMDRSAEDLNRAAKTIDGSFEDILTKATNRLSGHAKQQAQTVLGEFDSLAQGTGHKSVAMMEALASIFGVDYTPPTHWNGKGGTHALGNNQGGVTSTYGGHSAPNVGMAAGGTLPGWSPGYDNTHFIGPGGQRLSLAGGESVMVPEFTRAVGEAGVKELNRRAKNGDLSFAGGGTIPQGRINAAKAFAKAQEGEPYVWGGVGPLGYDCSGFMSAITNVLRGGNPYSRVGATASFPWGGFVPGPGQFTIGSTKNYGGSGIGHMAGTLDGMNVESRGGEGVVIGSRARGYRDSGFNTVAHLGDGGLFGYGGSSSYLITREDIKKTLMHKVYDGVEKQTGQLSQVQPFNYGDMSGIMNKFYGKAIDRFYRKHKDKILTAAISGGGGDLAFNAPDHVSGNKAIVQSMAAKRGWVGNEWDALYQLVMSESGFNNFAQNPTSTAYGMFQFLDSTWGPYGKKTSDPRLQTKYGLQYIANRYNDPMHAWAFHKANNWYGDGAVFTSPQQIGIAERGPEMVLPLNEKGADFINTILAKSQVGAESKQTNTYNHAQPVAHNMYNTYNIDRSTTFSGAINVTADDPNKFLHVLRQKQRAQALTRPSIGGNR